ncbi:hypothetical protein BMS3Abin14_01505 [bacterium BMS3Abin14]|nr:hypothetical protein BMS3Abin14_01505 [bacterium BMS3Abin14]
MKEQILNVTFIVNGVDVEIEVTPNQLLKTGRNKVLKLSNNIGRPAIEWEIHSDAGQALNPNKTFAAERVGSSDRLFLNLAVGFGG